MAVICLPVDSLLAPRALEIEMPTPMRVQEATSQALVEARLRVVLLLVAKLEEGRSRYWAFLGQC